MDSEDLEVIEVGRGEQPPPRPALSLAEAQRIWAQTTTVEMRDTIVNMGPVPFGGAYRSLDEQRRLYRSAHNPPPAVDWVLPEGSRVSFLGLVRNSLRWW